MVDTLVLLGFLGLVTFALGAWVVFRRGWLGGFFIGLVGMSSLALAAVVIMVTLRLFAYEPLTDGRVGTLSVAAGTGPDEYRISLTQDRAFHRYDLLGDTWRASVRVLQVPAYLVWGPQREVFVMRRVEGRFQDMEREFRAQRGSPSSLRSQYDALADRLLMSLFSYWDQHTALLPMANEAIFHLELRASSLRLVPVNEPAEAALDR